MEATQGEARVFVSYATPDAELTKALVNLLRLGCDLADRQVFTTARPGTLQPGVEFTEAIRVALDEAAMAILLLTPAFYESRFCLAEAGAVWVQEKVHVPLIVPPIDYHDLDGVQLGREAMRLDSPTDLDGIRDLIREVTGKAVPTGAWNEHKEAFLNRWTTEFEGSIQGPTAYTAEEYLEASREAETRGARVRDLSDDVSRLKKYTQELDAQNRELRELVPSAPEAPALEGDENAQAILDAERAIEVARAAMETLPDIARETLFQFLHDGRALTVGGYSDRFTIEDARRYEEEGYLSTVEDAEQQVTPRHDHPDVDAAETALARVREAAFDGWSYDSRAQAGDWIRPILKEKYGITDPTFELRPVWEALGFL